MFHQKTSHFALASGKVAFEIADNAFFTHTLAQTVSVDIPCLGLIVNSR